MRSPAIRKTVFLILALFVAGSAKTQNFSTEEEHIQLDKPWKDSLVALLNSYNSSGYFVAPNIPPDRLKKASEKCRVVPEDKILALLDLTVVGNARNCLLISTSGVYFHNGGAGEHPGRYFFPFSTLKSCNIEPFDRFEVIIGPSSVDLSGSDFTPAMLIGLLMNIRNTILIHL